MRKLWTIALLVGFGLTCFTAIAAAETNYICIEKHNNGKYVVHASSAQAQQNAIANNQANIWFLTTEKHISELAQAGVFGTYDTPQAVMTAICDGDAALQAQLVCSGGFKEVSGLE